MLARATLIMSAPIGRGEDRQFSRSPRADNARAAQYSHCGAFSIAQRVRAPPSIHIRLGLFRLHTFWALCNRFGGVRSIDFGAISKINYLDSGGPADRAAGVRAE